MTIEKLVEELKDFIGGNDMWVEETGEYMIVTELLLEKIDELANM